MFQTHDWQRDARNPIFPPRESFDCNACMNPFVMRQGDEYWMFYAGGDSADYRRICLATCPIDEITNWKRMGPLFDVGGPDTFDEWWNVLPTVHRFGERWHLYFTGRRANANHLGLQAFGGVGLATSHDLLNWTKCDEPVLDGSGFERWPNSVGIASGGSIIETSDEKGASLYRMYYTLAVGTPSPDLLVDQEKHTVCADSYDGLKWFNRQLVLSPRAEADYENAATAALRVWKTPREWRAIYAGIGTRFGAYSLCEASSPDGIVWERGAPDENLALAPSEQDGNGIWANKMCEYPSVIEENGRLRLFYCGNGYGNTGIGTAVAQSLD